LKQPAAPFQIRLISHAGEVLVTFSEPTEMLTLSPAGAREIAAKLVAMADAVEQAATPSVNGKIPADAALTH
jgi:hypothetical protein